MNLGCVCEIMNARNPLTRFFMASLAFHFSSAISIEKKVNRLAAVFLFLEKKIHLRILSGCGMNGATLRLVEEGRARQIFTFVKNVKKIKNKSHKKYLFTAF